MRRRAILVGCDRYESFDALRFAEKDAADFATGLMRYWGFEEREILLLTSDGEGRNRASRERIAEALAAISRLGRLDALIFGFWGHGVSSPDGRELYLCQPETKRALLAPTAMAFGSVVDATKFARASDVVFYLDCCRSFGRGEGDAVSPAEIARIENGTRDVQAARNARFPENPQRTATFGACQVGQIARDDNLAGCGLFTGRFLEAQRRCAKRGVFDCGSVARLTDELVRERSAELGFVREENGQIEPLQTPLYFPQGEGDISFQAEINETARFMSAADPVPRVASAEPAFPLARGRKRFPRWILAGTSLAVLVSLGTFAALAERRESPEPEPNSPLRFQFRDWRSAEMALPRSLDELERLADEGNVVAMDALGVRYANGIGVEPDLAKASELFRQSAEGGYPKGERHFALVLFRGRGVERDLRRAFQLRLAAAEKGDPNAMFDLARAHYQDGVGVEQDSAKAAEWYERAATFWHGKACNNLGLCYAEGRGVERDLAKAVEAYRKADFMGVPEGSLNLGNCYWNGAGVEPDANLAFAFFQRAARAGNPRAMNNLAVCFARGEGTERDASRAIELYRESAERGVPEAMTNLGRALLDGNGTDPDPEEGVRWLRQAVESGLGEAMEELGRRYFLGSGVELDFVAALQWRLKALEAGDRRVASEIGRQYREGLGVEIDPREASKYYRIAAEEGDERAKEILRELPSEEESEAR